MVNAEIKQKIIDVTTNIEKLRVKHNKDWAEITDNLNDISTLLKKYPEFSESDIKTKLPDIRYLISEIVVGTMVNSDKAVQGLNDILES